MPEREREGKDIIGTLHLESKVNSRSTGEGSMAARFSLMETNTVVSLLGGRNTELVTTSISSSTLYQFLYSTPPKDCAHPPEPSRINMPHLNPKKKKKKK